METYLRDQPINVIKAIDAIARGINAGQTTVFCGAGISYNSGLPIVAQLIPYVLLKLCASKEECAAIERELNGIEDIQAKSHELIKRFIP